jgi:hypothetical protein
VDGLDTVIFAVGRHPLVDLDLEAAVRLRLMLRLVI